MYKITRNANTISRTLGPRASYYISIAGKPLIKELEMTDGEFYQIHYSEIKGIQRAMDKGFITITKDGVKLTKIMEK